MLTRTLAPALALLLLFAGSVLAEITVDGNTLRTDRIVITAGPSGLPQQIAVQPTTRELPLDVRDAEEVPESVLRAIGRGPMLSEAVSLMAVVDGEPQPMQVTEPITWEAAGDGAVGQSVVTTGPLRVALDLRVDYTGAMFVTAELSGDAAVEALRLSLQVNGAMNTWAASLPEAPQGADSSPQHRVGQVGDAPNDEVTVSGQKNPNRPGLVPLAFLGSPDRGLTWLADPQADWSLDKQRPMVRYTRTDEGEVAWHFLLSNRPGALDGDMLRFALLPHPASQRPADARERMWLSEPSEAPDAIDKLWPARVGGEVPGDALLAHQAGLFDGVVPHRVLAGGAGGELGAPGRLHDARYGNVLFRYLAGTHTGQTGRVRTDHAALFAAGSDPAADRVLLGRALLHDIGVDPTTLSHPGEALRVLRGLDEFADFFGDDANSEFIPYWRGESVLRYGPVFQAGDAFAITTEDPLTDVHVSAYVRPVNANRPDGPRHAVIVIVNQQDEPVRDQLYILDRQRLFGGPNRLRFNNIAAEYDYADVVQDPNSDWHPRRFASVTRGKTAAALMDLEDQGYVHLNERTELGEVYGPHLFVPANGMRVLYGRGR